jgi:hypothetical protein
LRAITTRRAFAIIVGAALLAAFASAAPALAATPPTAPTITSAFTPNVVGVGGTSTLAFTITDTNSSGTETGIGFTDTLPAGLVVDAPNGESGTCGTNGVVTANSGTSTINLTAGSLKGGASGASGTNCVVSVNVTSNTPAAYSNNTGLVTSSDGSSATGDTETLTVVGNPTITATAPANNATFKFGQKVDASYSCAEAANGPGIIDCSATDNDGNSINSGSPLDTKIAGPNQLTISATSADGLVVTDTINYTVRPDNQITVTHVKADKHGAVSFEVKVPGRGKLVALETASKVAFGAWTDQVNGAKVLHVTVKPGAKGQKLLKTHPSKLTVSLTLAYTPKGGTKSTKKIGGIKIPS